MYQHGTVLCTRIEGSCYNATRYNKLVLAATRYSYIVHRTYAPLCAWVRAACRLYICTR